ncbi:unnamed protein product, partial [Gongylonema pulchrum]|uniref:Polyprotein n=1 Tax=Gongylonema pulchrum TaxID=637853 RepID=A0A183DKS0_9BILA
EHELADSKPTEFHINDHVTWDQSLNVQQVQSLRESLNRYCRCVRLVTERKEQPPRIENRKNPPDNFQLQSPPQIQRK